MNKRDNLLILCATGVCLFAGMANASLFFDGAVDQKSKLTMQNARERIEQIRKGDFTLKVLNGKGDPVNGEIEILLDSHEFRFGANLTAVYRLSKHDPARQKGLDVISKLFNHVRVGSFWRHDEPRQGSPLRWDDVDEQVRWAQKHDMTMRYHCLIYTHEPVLPSWHKDIQRTEDWWPLIEKRIKVVAARYGRLIYEYDVINEMVLHRDEELRYTTHPPLGNPQNGIRVFEIAEKYLPDAVLVPLETHTLTKENPIQKDVFAYYRALLDGGAKVGAIGHQAHFYAKGSMPFEVGHPEAGKGAFTMAKLEEGLDWLSELGKPIHITEFSPPSRGVLRQMKKLKQPGLSNEEIAAWETNYYTLVFSKPYIHQITRWFVIDLVGGKGVDAGLVTRDGKFKPSYFVLRKLLRETWTTDWKGTVQNGSVTFRGFYGNYKVKISGYKEAEVFFGVDGDRRKKLVLDAAQ
jgi:endo-1,4-beta-xylanase